MSARTLKAILLLIASLGSGCAKREEKVEVVRAAIQGQIDRNLAAVAAHDSVTYWSIFTDDYTYRGFDGRIVTRAEAERGFRQSVVNQLPMAPESKVTIDSLRVRRDTADVYTTQHIVRKGVAVDSVEHLIVANVTRHETWVRTSQGWKTHFVEEMTVGPTTVDSQEAEIDLTGMRFVRAYWAGGLDSLQLKYMEYKSSVPGTPPFKEATLNALARTLLAQGQMMDAINVFAMNADAYPRSANAWAELGQAYAVAGHRDEAIQTCKRALQLDAGNEIAKETLEKLGPS